MKDDTLTSSVEIIRKDKYGNILFQEEVPCDSLLRQFQQYWYARLTPKTEVVTDTGGSGRTVGSDDSQAVTAAVTNDNYGILVGSNNTAVVIDDYGLNTKIAHGSGAGELEYGLTIVTNNETASEDYVMVSRIFTNTSGGDVTVREAGLCTLATPYYFLIAREVITEQVLANTETLTINYKIKIQL